MGFGPPIPGSFKSIFVTRCVFSGMRPPHPRQDFYLRSLPPCPFLQVYKRTFGRLRPLAEPCDLCQPSNCGHCGALSCHHLRRHRSRDPIGFVIYGFLHVVNLNQPSTIHGCQDIVLVEIEPMKMLLDAN